MANNYLEFSAALAVETDEERDWLKRQLTETPVEYDEEHNAWVEVLPETPHEAIPRFLLDYSEQDTDEPVYVEFAYEWLDDGIVFYSEETGSPEQVAHLVQKFLQRFHPDKSWGLTWANVCSKPRPDEFGGGAVLVTAQGQRWMNTWDWLEAEQERHGRERETDPAQDG